MTYVRNRACTCLRCRCCGLMWPAILVLLGVLFMLDNFWVIRFGKTWPLIMVVAGLIWVLQSTASTAGHVEPGPPPMPGLQAPPPPPVNPDDKQVHHV